MLKPYVPVPPWGLAVTAILSVQLGSALSVGLIDDALPIVGVDPIEELLVAALLAVEVDALGDGGGGVGRRACGGDG